MNLPELPELLATDHPDHHAMAWTEMELAAIRNYARAYGTLCAAQATERAAKKEPAGSALFQCESEWLALRAKVEALTVDAERMDWLESQPHLTMAAKLATKDGTAAVRWITGLGHWSERRVTTKGESLRAAIDSARSAS